MSERQQADGAPAATAVNSRVRVGWLQSHSSGEMEVALAAAKRHAEVVRLDSVDAALDALDAQPMRAVVLAQPRRGVWLGADCVRLQTACPVTQLIGVHGSWCEGWQRTGHPWPGVEHLYWHQVSGSIARLIHSPPLPSTAERDERLSDHDSLARLRAFRDSTSVLIDVAISAPAPAFSALKDALTDFGLEAFLSEEREHATLGIWDGDVRFQSDRDRLDRLHKTCDGRLLAVALSPRHQDWRQIESWTSDILTKPFQAADLYGWLANQIADLA